MELLEVLAAIWYVVMGVGYSKLITGHINLFICIIGWPFFMLFEAFNTEY